MAWRIARRSSPFSFAWENALLIALKTPRDEWVCYDSFITWKLFSFLFCSPPYSLPLKRGTLSGETQYVATYGRTLGACSEAADFGDKMKHILGWPKSLHQQPSHIRRLQKRIKELGAILQPSPTAKG